MEETPRRSDLTVCPLVPCLACALAAGAPAGACDGTCMAAGSALALAGENDVPVAVTGRHDSGIRAFSLSLGHDASRLALQSIDLGPPFAEAELVSTTI